MTTAIRFFVPGIPAPQGSKRYLGNRGGKGIMVESSTKAAPWRSDVRNAATNVIQHPIDGAVELCLTFVMPRPKSHYRTGKNAHLLRDTAPCYPASKPDIDKLQRAVLDALTGLAWHDDAQIVACNARQLYADRYDIDMQPGMRVRIHELKGRT